MARKKDKKDVSVGKSIGILFLYLFLWWILLTLITVSLSIPETSILYQVISLLRIAVPILVVLFGCPIILIVGTNKNIKRKKKK
jgi:hypothetical protein